MTQQLMEAITLLIYLVIGVVALGLAEMAVTMIESIVNNVKKIVGAK